MLPLPTAQSIFETQAGPGRWSELAADDTAGPQAIRGPSDIPSRYDLLSTEET